MQSHNGRKLQLDVAEGEVISLEVINAEGIAPAVNYSFNGMGAPLPLAIPFKHAFHKPDPVPSVIGVLVTYTSDNDGAFTLKISSDRGGEPVTVDITQAQGEANRFLGPSFFLA
jgi:hypothetical protein